ncbi:MAG: glycosyltransferase, partial [Chitinivibrionales bacterium]
QPLRVMQITHDLEIGGLQRVVVTLCKTIRRDLFTPSVLCLRRQGPFARELQEHGVEVFSIPRKPDKADYFAFLKIARVLRKQRIDVIHTHNTEPLMDGTMGAILAGVKTIVHTDHARRFPDKKRYMVAERLLSCFVYRMIGVSEDTSQNLRHYEKIASKRLMTIPNGIDPDPYTVAIDRNAVRERLGLSQQGLVIGTVARLSPEKTLEDAIEAFSIVVKRFPDACLLIVGEGPCEEQLRGKASEMGVAQRVVFAGRHCEIAPLVRAMDVFVLSSSREGLPMAVLEAMAGGCPIVSYAVGGVPSAIKDGQSGYLVHPGDIESLARRIKELLDRPALRMQFGENAQMLFAKQFSAEPMTRAYERLYMRRAVMVES